MTVCNCALCGKEKEARFAIASRLLPNKDEERTAGYTLVKPSALGVAKDDPLLVCQECISPFGILFLDEVEIYKDDFDANSVYPYWFAIVDLKAPSTLWRWQNVNFPHCGCCGRSMYALPEFAVAPYNPNSFLPVDVTGYAGWSFVCPVCTNTGGFNTNSIFFAFDKKKQVEAIVIQRLGLV